MTTLQVNRLHHPVTALGHGRRAGVWLQGCSLGCRGCASRDTWDSTAGDEVSVDELLRWLDRLPEPLDGLTVSGGEPLEQPAALTELLIGVDAWRRRRARPFDVLLFTGRAAHTLYRGPTATAVTLCDAIVAGPYVDGRNTGSGALLGSDNQRWVLQTDLARERYEESSPTIRLQVSTDAERTCFIGIPRRGDLERLRARVAADGVVMGDVTWRS